MLEGQFGHLTEMDILLEIQIQNGTLISIITILFSEFTGWATQLESIVIGSNTPFLGVGGNVIAAVKLNDNNNFAGYCQQRVGYNNDLIAELPCYWSSPSNPINIGNLGGDFGRSTDLNNKGEVVGYSELANSNNHAFFYGDGNLIDLGTLGGDVSKAYSINENSWIVGYSTLITGGRTCLFMDTRYYTYRS